MFFINCPCAFVGPFMIPIGCCMSVEMIFWTALTVACFNLSSCDTFVGASSQKTVYVTGLYVRTNQGQPLRSIIPMGKDGGAMAAEYLPFV